MRSIRAAKIGKADRGISLEIDGVEKAVKVQIDGLNKALVEELPDLSLDLLEIASIVYAVDAAVSRGGPTDRNLGAAWYRTFDIEMPVRCRNVWERSDVQDAIKWLLEFLSGDTFKFTFVEHEGLAADQGFFKFAPSDAWQPDRVLMFSGGLDSFAGALEEAIEHSHKVALISHFSSTKIAPRQRALKQALEAHCGEGCCKHFPVRIHLAKGSNKETTYRTRSFLFAVLGTVVARSFGQDRVSFHENGVVSLNLPPAANVVGTRATRTTHPQTLSLMTDFFQTVLETPFRIDNPYFYRTKTDVVATIDRLGLADQIVETNSCADTRNRTEQYPHCGRCSQCIDRRFAIMAASLENYDPDDAYAVPLMSGPRSDVRDREIALSYVRNALNYEVFEPVDLQNTYPAVFDAVGYLELPPDVGLSQIHGLLQRHGKAVASVMRTKAPSVGQATRDSLPALFGQAQREPRLAPSVPETVPSNSEKKIEVVFFTRTHRIEIDGIILIKGAKSVALLAALADQHLEAAGQGLELFDYPCILATQLAKKLHVTEETLRRQISRIRSDLKGRFQSAGIPNAESIELIENIPWHGYRLASDRVTVRRKD